MPEGLDVVYFRSESNLNAQLVAAALQDLEQTKARNAGKTVAVNGNFFVAMNDIDIVPCLEVSRDLVM